MALKLFVGIADQDWYGFCAGCQVRKMPVGRQSRGELRATGRGQCCGESTSPIASPCGSNAAAAESASSRWTAASSEAAQTQVASTEGWS